MVVDKPSMKLLMIVIILLPVSLSFFTGNTSMNISIADFLLPFLFITSILCFTRHKKLFSDKQIRFIKKVTIWSIIFLMLVFFSIIQVLRFDNLTTEIFKNSIFNFLKLLICALYAFSFVIYLFYFKNINRINDIYKISTYSLLIFSIGCITGYVLYFFGVNSNLVQHGFRARGTLLDTNLAACFILSFIFFPVISYYKTKKMVFFVTILIAIFALLTTCSKAGVLILLFCALLVLIMVFFLNHKLFLKLLIFAIFAVISFALISKYTNLLDSLFLRLNELNSDSADKVTTGRSSLWEIAFDILFNKNAMNSVFGIGIGMFMPYVEYYYPESNILLVHNTFLSLWVETGFVTFAFLSCTFIYLLLKIVVCFIRGKNIIDLFAFFSFLSLFIYMNSVNMQNNRFVYFVVLIIALHVSQHKILYDNDENTYDYLMRNYCITK